MNLQIWCGLQWEKSRSDSWIKEKSAGGKSRHFLHFYIIQTNIIIFPTLQTEAAWNLSLIHIYAYIPSNTALHALIGGGSWGGGVRVGSRAVIATGYPWYVNGSFGVWCVCDAQ